MILMPRVLSCNIIDIFSFRNVQVAFQAGLQPIYWTQHGDIQVISHIFLLMCCFTYYVNIDLRDHFFVLSVIMKDWKSGWKLGILACSDLRCCFQWDSQRMSVLLLGDFPLKGKNTKSGINIWMKYIKCCQLLTYILLRTRFLQHLINVMIFFVCSWLRPTMILYGIDNIRDLFGHKVLTYVCILSSLLCMVVFIWKFLCMVVIAGGS